jgi:hypothetical protein
MYRSARRNVISCYFCAVSPVENLQFPCLGFGVSSCGLCIENFQLRCTNPICTNLISVNEEQWSSIRKGTLVSSLCSICDRANFKKCSSCNTLFKRIAGRLPIHLGKITYPNSSYITQLDGSYLCDRCIRYCDECKVPGLCEKCSDCDQWRCQLCSEVAHICPHRKNKRRYRKRKSMTDSEGDQGRISPEYCAESPPYL